MSKYNANAGFKNFDVNDEPSFETVTSPFSKFKSGVIIGGVVLGVLTVVIVLMTFLASNNTSREDGSTKKPEQSKQENLDYDELFNVDTNDDEDITIENPYASLPNEKAATQTTTAPAIIPPSTTKPIVNPTKPSTSSNSPSAKSNASSSGTANNSNNGSSSSGSGSASSSGGGGTANNSSGSTSQQNTASTSSSQAVNKPSSVEVSSVSISKSSLTLTKGVKETLSASVSPSNATNRTITWSSGNNSVATVSNGQIIAVGAGTTKIYASSNNGKKAECSVTVKEPPAPVDNVSINPTEKTIIHNRTATIELVGASKCTWRFSNPFVLEQVSVSGTTIKVKGLKKGMSNVEAVLPNGKTYKCKITVK